MPPIRAAILGTGSFAHKHAQILASLPGEVELAAFCNRTLDKAQAYAAQYTGGKAPVFSDHNQMLAQVPLDLLVICLPPFAHTDAVEQAAARGVHVFIEKPIALTSEKAWQMVEASERAGIHTQVGFMFRFGAAVEQMKALLASGQAGAPGLMSARYFCNSLHSAWWRQRHLSGGQLVEQVIHMVDLMRYLMGEPAGVFSRQENLFHRGVPDYTVEDVSATLVHFAGGALGVIYASNAAIPGQWSSDYRLVTQNITAAFADANHASLTFTALPGTPTQEIAADDDLYRKQMLDLLHAIRAGGSTRTPMREGARSLDLALAAVRSAQEGREVALP